MKQILFLIAGPSGTGKDAAVDIVCRTEGLSKVISRTSRPRRYEDEATHIFESEEKMRELYYSNLLISRTFFDGHYYGVLEEDIQGHDIFITDIPGIRSIRAERNPNLHTYVIAVTASEPTRIYRMTARGDTKESVLRRIEHDRNAFRGLEQLADKVIRTDRLNTHQTAEMLSCAVHMLRQRSRNEEQNNV